MPVFEVSIQDGLRVECQTLDGARAIAALALSAGHGVTVRRGFRVRGRLTVTNTIFTLSPRTTS